MSKYRTFKDGRFTYKNTGEVAGSNPGRTNTLNNWEESAAFVMTSANS